MCYTRPSGEIHVGHLDPHQLAHPEAGLKEGPHDKPVPRSLPVGLPEEALKLLGGQGSQAGAWALVTAPVSREGSGPSMHVAGFLGRQVDPPVEGGDLADEAVRVAFGEDLGALVRFASVDCATKRPLRCRRLSR